MLPLELVDLLLDFVHSDTTTLAVCALVCRDWLPSARFHLLSKLSLDSTNADSFFDELDDIGVVAFPKFTASGLGNVTSLRLDGLDLSSAPAVLPQLFPNLRSLCLEGFEADSFSIVASWISGLPLLRSLRLSGDWDGDEGEGLPVAEVPKLTDMDLNCPLRVLLGWFLSHATVPVTSSLVLRDIWSEEAPTISRYLAATGATLETLVLVYPRKEIQRLDLTHNINLRSLSFECYVHALPRVTSDALLRLHPRKLEHLRMSAPRLPPGYPTAIEIYEWGRLNVDIMGLDLQHLRSIELLGLQPYVKRLMPVAVKGVSVTGD
ncbi:hypothetical protein B0H15DRAFT_308028 [Mycena belliarum]|uniref:F-box domain-containing protein n=1 Tax=Mycena belliarum TaxID=1033014 RepID=A0AAD6U6E9_9AGAR|nr:hypothetical protein B0H15DRAFT_308028 [Mycena belliae]